MDFFRNLGNTMAKHPLLLGILMALIMFNFIITLFGEVVEYFLSK